MSKHILVLGLGNTLLADDGVGVHVVRRLAAGPALPDGVRTVDGGTMGFRLTAMLSDAGSVLIIDAADIGLEPGTIRLLDQRTLDAHVAKSNRTSAHEAGLADLLSLARLENLGPRHLAVLAIQPQEIAWRESLSDPVEGALAPACVMATATIMEWHRAA
jgi:hydrogenase maturation protease